MPSVKMPTEEIDFKEMLKQARQEKKQNADSGGGGNTPVVKLVNLKTKVMKPSHLHNLLQLPQSDRESKYLFWDFRNRAEYDAMHVRGFSYQNENSVE